MLEGFIAGLALIVVVAVGAGIAQLLQARRGTNGSPGVEPPADAGTPPDGDPGDPHP